MILPPGRNGAAFSESIDGDMRHDFEARAHVSETLGIPSEWAIVRQVHGDDVVNVVAPGDAGEADALWTTETRLPVVVLTADCLGVVLHADGAVGVAHCGWRGVVARVAERLRQRMTDAGYQPSWAAIGPGIGPCCFEVGPDVSEPLYSFVGETTWGTTSVDLVAALRDQLGGIESWSVGRCTHHDQGWFSHRRDGDTRRMATIGWLQ
jgi:YfiH family protein